MFVVGLTGGIGSGKTTVTTIFKDLGVTVVDTDEIARLVVKPGTLCLKEISQHFGPQMLGANGELDRAALRKVIFASNKDKTWLENLLHPEIRKETRRQIAVANSPYSILSSPLLLESPDKDIVDRIVVVDVPPEVQIARASERDSNNEAQIKAIINTQINRDERLAMADDIIDNSGTLENTRDQVLKLHDLYLKKSMHHPRKRS